MRGNSSQREHTASDGKGQGPELDPVPPTGISPRTRSTTVGFRDAAEHCAQDVVGFADVLRTAPPRDERVDFLGLLGRHGAVLVADVGEVAQRNAERDRYVVETVEGN